MGFTTGNASDAARRGSRDRSRRATARSDEPPELPRILGEREGQDDGDRRGRLLGYLPRWTPQLPAAQMVRPRDDARPLYQVWPARSVLRSANSDKPLKVT